MPYKDPKKRKEAARISQAVYRKKHPEKVIARIKRDSRTGYYRLRRKELHNWVDELKSNPCMDCKLYYHPTIMDYDHVRGRKDKGIANMISLIYSKARILKEIAKCDLVCSNCHRLRTWTRRQQKQAIPLSLINVQ